MTLCDCPAVRPFAPAIRVSLCLGLFTAVPAAAAAPQVWSQSLATGWHDQERDATSDGAGGIVVVGTTTGSLGGPHQGNWDGFVARLASTGTVLWKAQHGTPSTDWVTSVARDGTGGFFVAGETWGSLAATQNGNGDPFVARYDALGTLLWIHQYGTSSQELDVCVTSDGAGGAFLACDTGAAWSDGRDILVLRLDGVGNVLWTQQFGSAKADVLGHIASDGVGGAYLCGGTSGALAQPSQGAFDAWVARMDGNGTISWVSQEGTVANDSFDRMVVDGQNRVYLAGYTLGDFEGFLATQANVLVARYDAGGVRVWSKSFGTPTLERTSGLALDGTGGIVVMGETQGALHGAPLGGLGDLWLQRLQDDGSQVWAQQFGTTQPDWGGVVCEAGPGSFIAAGSTQGDIFGQLNQGNGDVFVAMFDGCSSGNLASYCPAGVNSTGAPAQLSSKGSASIAANDLELHVAGATPSNLGVMILGTGKLQVPFGDGMLCLGGTIQRFLPPLSISPQGGAALYVDFLDPTQPASQIPPGSTRYFQFWYRDTGSSGAGFNLSNGLSATFCP